MRYIFSGRCRTESFVKFDVKNPPLRLTVRGGEGGDWELALLLSGGFSMALVVTTNSAINDIATFRNQIATIWKSIYDAATFLSGQAVTIEVLSLTEVETNRFWTFRDFVPELAESAHERPLPTEGFINLAIRNECVRSALADLNEAITSPNDTGFYCYRAIETLMQGCKQPGETDNKKAWPRFREAVQVTQEWIKPLTDSSISNRHGEFKGLSGKDRVLLMKRSWTLLYRFACLKLRDVRALPVTEFPLLQ